MSSRNNDSPMTVFALAATIVVASQLAGGYEDAGTNGYSVLDLLVGFVALAVMISAPYSPLNSREKLAYASVFGLIIYHLLKTISALFQFRLWDQNYDVLGSLLIFVIGGVLAYAGGHFASKRFTEEAKVSLLSKGTEQDLN